MKIISLGWGVQSFTLAAMSALGELPKVDYAIHADTTHESQLTYEFAKRWTGWLEERGVKVITVANQEKKNIIDKWGGMQIPAFTSIPEHYEISDGYYFYTNERDETEKVFDSSLVGQKIKIRASEGQIRRQCTHEWKIRPIREWISKELERQGLSKTEGIIEQWIGISWDEIQRMKPADVKYIENVWPLIDKRMTRKDCKSWLSDHVLEIPPRSACTFCPFKKTSEWRQTKNIASDWKEAVSVDAMIRNARPPQDLFVHPSRKPLEYVDFRTEQEKGQLSLWDDECTGICGV